MYMLQNILNNCCYFVHTLYAASTAKVGFHAVQEMLWTIITLLCNMIYAHHMYLCLIAYHTLCCSSVDHQ